MSVSAVKWVLWSAGAIAVVMFFAAISPAFDRSESLALVLGAGLLTVVTTLWYRRAMPAAEAREEARQAEQLATLKQQLTLTREPILVQASSGILFLTLLVAVLIYCAGAAFVSPSAFSIGVLVFILFVTAGLALIYVPRIGKPALTIRPEGLEIPVVGLFRWDEIESIGLRSYTSKGATTHSLDLYVPQLRVREDRLHPLLKLARRALLRGGGNFVVIHLLRPSLPATLVHTLCHDLWKERTGKSRTWSSVLSAEDIEEMRRGDQHLAMLERIGEMAETDPAEAMQRLDDLKKRFPIANSKSQRPLSPAAAKRRDALAADLRTIDTRDRAAVKKVLDKHAKEYSRALATKLVIVVVVLVALAVVANALIGE
jgi:hypothetical protein